MTTSTVELIREAAEKVAFQSLTEPPELSTEQIMVQQKLAAVEDQELLGIAYHLSGNVEEALRDYESFGGTYKHAFGQQMFDSTQMSGSPAVSGGMQMRSSTQAGQAASSAPAVQQAPAAPKAPGSGAASSGPTVSITSTPSSSSTPTG